MELVDSRYSNSFLFNSNTFVTVHFALWISQEYIFFKSKKIASHFNSIVNPANWSDKKRAYSKNKYLLFYVCGPNFDFYITDQILKYGSQEKVPFCCRCSILFGLTFVEIKNSFTKTFLVFNSKNVRIICYWKKIDKSEPI